MQSDFAVDQVSDGPGAAVHAYFDICPESPDGDRFVYFSFPGAFPGPGRMVVADADATGHRAVGPVLPGVAHTGARQLWVDNDTVAGGRIGADGPETVLVSVDTGESRAVAGVLRMASPAGDLGLTSSQEVRRLNVEPEEEAVHLMHLGSGRLERLFALEDMLALHPMRDEIPDGERRYLAVKHTKWSTDGARFLVVFTNLPFLRKCADLSAVRSPAVKSLFVANADGSGLRYVGEFGSHPFWGDASAIWSVGHDKEGATVEALSANGGEPRILARRVPGSHVALSPDGARLVMDVFQRPAPGFGQVWTLDMRTDERTLLVTLATPDLAHQTGCHPHPVWSQDGGAVYFNAAEDGVPHVHRVRLATAR